MGGGGALPLLRLPPTFAVISKPKSILDLQKKKNTFLPVKTQSNKIGGKRWIYTPFPITPPVPPVGFLGESPGKLL